MYLKNLIQGIIILTVSAAILSCENEEYVSDSSATLEFSADTVTFDTVFTKIGSTTKRFTVKNPYNKNIVISSIELAGDKESDFRLNINGIKDTKVNDTEIKAKDSLFVFVEVTVDPTDSDNPMVIKDSVVFNTKQNRQDVKLIAWGQDVNLVDGEVLETQTWSDKKPYLIYNSALVDTGHTLTIEEGTRLHFHDNSGLFVAGTLIADGTYENPIIFEGDRLESYYENIPGQWTGIYMMPGSKNNYLNHTVIKNAIYGIWVDTLASTTTPTLRLSNTKIEHMTSIGLNARGSWVKASNCLISDCGNHAVALTLGGHYEFYHSTIANYWTTSTRSTPSVLLNNYYIDGNDQVQNRDLEKASFVNSIIYGNQGNEIGFDFKEGAESNFTFDHSLVRINPDFNTGTDNFNAVIVNKDPEFVAPYDFKYQLDSLSPAIDAGNPETGQEYPYDILNNSRIEDEAPDIGAFEHVPDSTNEE
ncbi:MAG: right-handed parallel beta-helix repeat-containing protein [Bacteroidales bacterium]